MKKKVANILISVIITVLLLYALKSVWGKGDVIKGLGQMELSRFVVAAVCYIMTYPFRSYRIYYMLRNEAGVLYKRVLPVCMKHQFYARIVPFKAGELSLLYLLKKSFSVAGAKGGTILVLLRLFDAAVMVGSFIVCNFFAKTGGWLSYLAAALLVAVLGVAAAAVFMFPKITGFLKMHGKDRLAGIAEDVAAMLKTIKLKDFLVLMLSTVLLWVFVYLSMHFVAAAFFEGLAVTKTVAASFLASVAAYLPVNGLGGFGTTEAGWTLGFSLVGMPRDMALVSGVVSNLMSFAVTVLCGLVSFVIRGDRVVQDNYNK